MRVLLIEDEPEMARLIAAHLGLAGYIVDRAASLAEASGALKVRQYGLVLLDRRLPDGDGLSLIPTLRASFAGVAILTLTALDSSEDKISGLDAGADDYLTKPVDFDELMARVRAVLRRQRAALVPPVTCGAVSFLPADRVICVHGAPIRLQRRELALLAALLTRSERVVQRHTLFDEVYGFDDDVQPATLDAHIARLRRRLRELDAGVAIHPVRGVGYMLSRAERV